MAIIRGLQKHQEQDPGLLVRDTRTIGERIIDFFTNPFQAMVVIVMLAMTALLLPGSADLMAVLGVGVFLFTYTRKITLPFRIPQRAKLPDNNDLIPGTRKPRIGRGICFFGNELSTNEELWFSNDDMRTHVLIFGSTGSGKTEALVSLAYNALVQGSGFIYVDGKGDNSLYTKVFSMVRSMGREDDMLLVNFMTGARDIIGPQEKRLSNTINPFSKGSSSMLTQLVVSMMDSSSASSDGDMWKGRAISFVEALMKLLVYMRDRGDILLDANTIRNYFHLTKLESIVLDKSFPRDKDEPSSLTDVPDLILEPITNYLTNLPGYNREKKGKQVSQVLEQHGFITMQLTRVFTSLADTYGHIMRTKLGEVDFHDVVLNRRILVVLLPALEKSPDELSALGKVMIASLKGMMAAGLGENVEGSYREVVERKPTNAPTPYICILDEYGYYAVEGFAVVPAQARSLGFSTIFAGQDLPAFQRASKEEALSIGANTNIKIAMKLEDPLDTWDFFQKTAGEAFITQVGGFQTNPGSVTNNYMDTRNASVEKRERVNLLDLKDQREGEAHIFFKSKIIRAKMFYANPTPVATMRLNQFLKVDLPTDRELIQFEQGLKQFLDAVEKARHTTVLPDETDDIEKVVEAYAQNPGITPIERGVSALLAYHNKDIEDAQEEEELTTDVDSAHMSVFTRLRLATSQSQALLCSDYDSFSQPLVNRSQSRSLVEFVERAMGRSVAESTKAAEDVFRDMESATKYPPEFDNIPSTAEFTENVLQLVEHIQNQPDTSLYDDA